MAPSEPIEPIAAVVVYCSADRQWLLPVRLPAGATLADAVAASGLTAQVPELQGRLLDLGVYNQRRPAHTPVQPGDRIEVYRPLRLEPMAARRLRAELRQRQHSG
jgi:putative ubiquitin-RnfH superfamily antitoxin RatB of RatAB toxin-antitoxin module